MSSAPSARILETKLSPPAFAATQVLRDAICERDRGQPRSSWCWCARPRASARPPPWRRAASAWRRAASPPPGSRWTEPTTTSRASSAGLGEAVLRLGVEEPRARTPFDAVAALAAHDAPFVLFLDDFEGVQEPAVIGLVREIVEHLPRGGKLVIGSRGLPDLGVGRLRARGQLEEIDTDRLRFSLEETGAFFGLRAACRRRRGAGPAARTARATAPKTEGLDRGDLAGLDGARAPWQRDRLRRALLGLRPRGGRLPGRGRARAPARRGARVPAAHQHPAPARCLGVPGAQPARRQRGHPRATGRGQPVPDARERRRGQRGAWRYHSLFADFLRARLAREMPGEIARLHLAASGWYESHAAAGARDRPCDRGRRPSACADPARQLCRPLPRAGPHAHALRAGSRPFPSTSCASIPVLQPIALWATCFTARALAGDAAARAIGLRSAVDAAVRARRAP